MSTHNKAIHYYHADATALGGTILRPVQENIAVQSPISLPPVGGFATVQAGDFRLHNIISAKATHSQVSGSVNPESGNPATMMTSVVEGLNVLNILTADRVVAQISAEHPKNGGYPRVLFLGTQIENLRVAGQRLDVILDVDIFSHHEANRFPKGPAMRDKKFLGKVRKKCDDNKGVVLCSLVKDIKGQFPGKRHANVLEIPEFGSVYLAELLIHCHSYQLIMMRMELGCPTQASLSAGSGKVNGSGGGG
jgi:hypothetical protein